jgi:hypothetical protein
MAIFTAWTNSDGVIELKAGEDFPHISDDSDVLLWRIEAATWEEASAIHHLRMGWEPYKPMGEPSSCPRCGSIFYSEGSGECWRCGKIE